jgi:hypothetical protein
MFFVVATIGAIFWFQSLLYNRFTPLRIYSNYSSSKLKDATRLALKSDSLTIALKEKQVYIQSIQKCNGVRIRKI